MLFFVDESWQTISGRRVGALGAVAIAQSEYNAFCGEVFAIKRQVLGADELSEHELKGQNALGKGQFKRQAQTGRSAWIDAVDRVFEALAKHQARIFVVWTTSPSILTLRHPGTTELSAPYKALLYDFRAYMRNEVGGSLGSLNFDQRGMKEDEAAACAVSNYLFRTRGDW
jgi:stalled ribosome alternative rescue factor ArfA